MTILTGWYTTILEISGTMVMERRRILSCDKFLEYAMAISKGTKMPRGDKKALMECELPEHNYVEQVKIVGVLKSIDGREV